MSIAQITEAEMTAKGVSSLPTRPNNPYAYGGENMSAADLKARFDELPRHIAARLNSLLAAVAAVPDLTDFSGGSLAELLLTGMFPSTRAGHTLAALFDDLLDGTAASYLSVGGTNLSAALDGKEDAPTVVAATDGTLTLATDRDYRFGTVTSLSLLLPANPADGFSATLSFDSGETNGATALDYPEGILWSGDDIIDGDFTVFGGKHYTLLFWYDGAWQAAVRGVVA